MLIGLIVALVVVLAAGAVVAVRALVAAQVGGRRLLEQRLGGIEGQLGQRLAGIEEKVDRRLESLDGRLLQTQRSAGETATEIVDRLVKLDGTAAQMLQQAAN